MQMTEEGLALIKRFEGFRGTAYLCPAGVWTIGYGHTSQAGAPEVTRGMQMKETMAAEVLESDVNSFAVGVTKELQRRISEEHHGDLKSAGGPRRDHLGRSRVWLGAADADAGPRSGRAGSCGVDHPRAPSEIARRGNLMAFPLALAAQLASGLFPCR